MLDLLAVEFLAEKASSIKKYGVLLDSLKAAVHASLRCASALPMPNKWELS